MNHALIDNLLLAIAFLIAFLATCYSKERITKAFPSFLLLLAPLIIFLNMWAHTVAVVLLNYQRYQQGQFHYSFSLYALLLFGIVFILVSGFNIHLVRKVLKGNTSVKRSIHWLNIGTALLFLPMILLNPIALLPVLASCISSLTLTFIKQPPAPRKTMQASFDPDTTKALA